LLIKNIHFGEWELIVVVVSSTVCQNQWTMVGHVCSFFPFSTMPRVNLWNV